MRLEELWNWIDDDKGVDLLEQYISEGGDVNARHPNSGRTLLHIACEHQNHNFIRALTKAGADLNAREKNQGWSPLHHAVDIDIDSIWQMEHSYDGLTFSTTRLLIALGADPGVLDKNGRTPRDMVAEYGKQVADKFDDLTTASTGRK
jgi:ankyrin repeat protein